VKGDHSLNSDQISFDGFRIVLKRISNEYFTPNYDVSLQNGGMLVAVEVPGLILNDSQQVENGNFSLDLEYSNQGAVLRIHGDKPPYYIIFEDEYVRRKTYLDNKQDVDSLQILSQYNLKDRLTGAFDLIIPIPINVSDDTNQFQTYLIDGVYWIFLPYKKKEQNMKPQVSNKIIF